MSTEIFWALLISGLGAVATTGYAILTWFLASETRRLREASTEPHVGVSVLPSEYAPVGFADLVIRNSGLGPAFDVQFIPEEATPRVANATLLQELRELGIVRNGIPYLAPGNEFRIYYTQLLGKSDAELTTNVHLRVKYRSLTNREYQPCYPLELGHFAKRMRIGRPPLQEIARELERLCKEVEQIRKLIERRIHGNET